MWIRLVALFICLSAEVYSQSDSIKHTRDFFDEIISRDVSSDSAEIYISDFETIDLVIRSVKKKYKIVYYLSFNCGASLEIFPMLTDFVKRHQEYELIPILGYRTLNQQGAKKYLRRSGFSGNAFMIDSKKHGNRRNPFSRLDKLTIHLCKDCNFRKMGYSSFYVFDEKNQVVLHNSWEVVGMEKFHELERFHEMRTSQADDPN